MSIFFSALITLVLLTTVKADHNLTIRMKSFLNPYSLNLNGLISSTTETLFRFCIKSEPGSRVCLAEFETDVIGSTSINSGQFKLTTDVIQLRVASTQVTSDFVLGIQALTAETRILVSEFTIEISLKDLNKWQEFSARNNFDQQLEVDYKLECGEFFEGDRCEKLSCINGCKNGGKCELMDGKPTCKCNKFMSKGDQCEIRLVHICPKCMNGASCLGNGECLCAPGYTGSRCQIKRMSSQCGQVTCYNGGTCVINNENQYSCVCHPAFTGKLCDSRIITTTTKSTTTSTTISTTKSTTISTTKSTTTSTTTSSTTSSTTSTKKSFDKTSTTTINTQTIVVKFINPTARAQLARVSSKVSVNQVNNNSYSLQEILMILVLGIGMPVLAILCSIILYRLNKKKKLSSVVDISGKKTEFESTEVVKKKNDPIENNLFDKNSMDETKICVNKISSTPKKSDLKLVENNIYSVFHSESLNIKSQVNQKNINNLRANFCQVDRSNEYGMMASMV